MRLIDALVDLFRPKYPRPPVDPIIARAIEGAEEGRREPDAFVRFPSGDALKVSRHDALLGPRC